MAPAQPSSLDRAARRHLPRGLAALTTAFDGVQPCTSMHALVSQLVHLKDGWPVSAGGRVATQPRPSLALRD